MWQNCISLYFVLCQKACFWLLCISFCRNWVGITEEHSRTWLTGKHCGDGPLVPWRSWLIHQSTEITSREEVRIGLTFTEGNSHTYRLYNFGQMQREDCYLKKRFLFFPQYLPRILTNPGIACGRPEFMRAGCGRSFLTGVWMEELENCVLK